MKLTKSKYYVHLLSLLRHIQHNYPLMSRPLLLANPSNHQNYSSDPTSLRLPCSKVQKMNSQSGFEHTLAHFHPNRISKKVVKSSHVTLFYV
jgi:hypothetical protein